MTFSCTGVLEILPLSVWNSGLATVDQTPALFSCWPFLPDSRVCVWVGVCPTCMAVSLAASLSDRNASPHAGEGDRRRQRLRAVASTVTAARANGSRRLLRPFPHAGSDAFPPLLPGLSPAKLSLPVIAAHLLGSASAGLSASLLRD